MGKKILDLLIERNEFPILFVGSGLSRRYLENYPSWEELLNEIWQRLGLQENFYAHLGKIKETFGDAVDSDFLVNTAVASELEDLVKQVYFDGKLEIEGLTYKDAYRNRLSPFKELLTRIFNSYQVKNNMREEIDSLKRMLLKSLVILTTNYDTLIEDLYNQLSKHELQTYIGQKGFFEQTPGYAELYKIHGCSTDSKTLVITEQDYRKFDQNSILISAKIISMLLHSPIIFIGYSLTDRNIRNILKDFANSLSEREKVALEERLIIIDWEEGQQEIKEEIISDSELGCRMTVIKTDNYLEIYRSIAKIHQGVAPSEIRRYQHVIKQLIVDRGKQGTLDTILVSPEDLDDLSELIGNKNMVIAIGDRAIIFEMPTITKYINEYISENFEHQIDDVLRFIAHQPPQSRLPFKKYLTVENIEKSCLHEREKAKLLNRLAQHSNLDNLINSVPYKKAFNNLDEIISAKELTYREYSYINYNAKKIPLDVLKSYLLKELGEYMEEGAISLPTEFRRLCLIYDLCKNKAR